MQMVVLNQSVQIRVIIRFFCFIAIVNVFYYTSTQ